MRILLTESDVGGGADIARQLAADGHEVVGCHAPGAAAFPCTGLTAGGACPLDSGEAIDVAVAVRTHPYPRPRPREIGVTCAVRAKVPVVTVGNVALDPFAPWSTSAEHQSLADAMTAALHKRDAAVAVEAAAAATRAIGPSADVTATAKVRGRQASVVLSLAECDRVHGGRVAVRTHGELRKLHPELSGIDVTVTGR